MEEFLGQLTHENELIESEWPEIHAKIKDTPLGNDPILILRLLTDYVHAEPIDSSICDTKYFLVRQIIDRYIQEVSLEIDGLTKIFNQSLALPRMDAWHLHFLEIYYTKFELGQRLSNDPIRTDLIEEALRSLMKKTFQCDSKELEESWIRFLTSTLFADQIDAENILNKENNLQKMSHAFEEFYRHAIRYFQYSLIWSKLAATLHQSSPSFFNDQLIANDLSIRTDIPLEHLSMDYVKQLTRLYADNLPAIQNQFHDLLILIERLAMANEFDQVRHLYLKLIVPNLSNIDLKSLLNLFIDLCSRVEQKETFFESILLPFVSDLEEISVAKEFTMLIFNLSKSILNLHLLNAPTASSRLLRRKDFFPWNDLHDDLIELLRICFNYDSFIEENYFSSFDELETLITFISEKAQVYSRILQQAHPIACEQILRWSQTDGHCWSPHVYKMARALLSLIDPQKVNEDYVLKLIDALFKRVNQQTNNVKQPDWRFFVDLSKYVGDYIEKLNFFSHHFHCRITELFLCTLGHPFYNEDHQMNLEYIILANALIKVTLTITTENDLRLYQLLVQQMYIQAKEENVDMLYQWWLGFWFIVGSKFPRVVTEHIDQFLDDIIIRKNMMLVSLLTILCMQDVECISLHLDELFETLFADHGRYFSALNSLMSWLVRLHPELVQSKYVDAMFSSLEFLPFNQELIVLFHSFASVAAHRPDYFDQHRTKLVDLVAQKQHLMIFECLQKYLIGWALLHDEHVAQQSMDILIDLIKQENISNDLRTQLIYTALVIGIRYPVVLVQRRNDWVVLNSTLLINFLDDNVKSEIDQGQIKRARLELEQIESSIDRMRRDVTIRTPDLLRLDTQQDTTIPFWITDVSKLLNRQAPNDWRSLGQQLDYTPSEIKHFSLKTDPCQTILHDWFMTHSFDEAISSLLFALDQINRHDAKQLIYQYVGTYEYQPCKVQRRAPIFLSFHSQEDLWVSSLKEHLERAGYACQMDDESTRSSGLEERIRGAKIVLCCIDTCYTKSEHCLRELDMTLKMKKPLICLEMSSEIRPSEGLVYDVLHNQLCLPFFGGQKTSDWLEGKFVELLARIRYHLAPNPDIMSNRYRHWFVPRLDHLIFLKSFQQLGSLATLPLAVVDPQIVLTYPWTNQRDALILYQKLTHLGYRVWLDIFQMSGGDPLVEKFTSALDQASCLLACITPKYLQSILGQRELLLANSSQKPIVPLWLEQIDNWTPIGPRSYIDFRHSDMDDRWIGKSFEILLGQLKQLMPNVDTDNSRHFLEMQRPRSGAQDSMTIEQRRKRITSAPLTPQSRACTVM